MMKGAGIHGGMPAFIYVRLKLIPDAEQQ